MVVARVIDTSHYNNVSSFQKVSAAGIWGVINKCTEGTGYVDSTYNVRRGPARDVGLLYGAYCFLRRGVNVAAQVEHFLKNAKPDDRTLLALDWENYLGGPAPTKAEAREFCERVASKVGRKPIIYSGNTAKEALGSTVDTFFGGHRLWLAQYSSRAICQRSWRTPWIWQFSGDGLGPMPHGVDGVTISGRAICDMNDYVLDDAISDTAVAQANFEREWVSDPSSSDQKPNAPQTEVGSRGVKWLQEQLNALGYRDASGKALNEDGDYGPLTTQAVKAFQKANPPLKADGVFGPLSSAALDSVLIAKAIASRGEPAAT